MNLEALLARKEQIEKEIAVTSNNYHMLMGHKADVEHWIAELAKQPEPEKIAELPIADEVIDAVE